MSGESMTLVVIMDGSMFEKSVIAIAIVHEKTMNVTMDTLSISWIQASVSEIRGYKYTIHQVTV
jgi:hypothetical protein